MPVRVRKVSGIAAPFGFAGRLKKNAAGINGLGKHNINRLLVDNILSKCDPTEPATVIQIRISSKKVAGVQSQGGAGGQLENRKITNARI